jgi:hypothetical protein
MAQTGTIVVTAHIPLPLADKVDELALFVLSGPADGS